MLPIKLISHELTQSQIKYTIKVKETQLTFSLVEFKTAEQIQTEKTQQEYRQKLKEIIQKIKQFKLEINFKNNLTVDDFLEISQTNKT